MPCSYTIWHIFLRCHQMLDEFIRPMAWNRTMYHGACITLHKVLHKNLTWFGLSLQNACLTSQETHLPSDVFSFPYSPLLPNVDDNLRDTRGGAEHFAQRQATSGHFTLIATCQVPAPRWAGLKVKTMATKVHPAADKVFPSLSATWPAQRVCLESSLLFRCVDERSSNCPFEEEIFEELIAADSGNGHNSWQRFRNVLGL